jgi:hypothetical protein
VLSMGIVTFFKLQRCMNLFFILLASFSQNIKFVCACAFSLVCSLSSLCTCLSSVHTCLFELVALCSLVILILFAHLCL